MLPLPHSTARSVFPTIAASRVPPTQVAACLISLLFSLQVVGVAWGQGRGPSPVALARVEKRQVTARQDFVANVTPNRRSTVGSPVDGRVDEFLVKAGVAVKKGQPLAKLRTRTIEIEIEAAESELRLRESELEEQRNGSRPEEINLARAQAAAAEAANVYAQAKLERFGQLYKSSSGLSKDEYEAARADALVAAANLERDRSSLRLAEEGSRHEQIAQAAARVAVQEQVVAGLRDRLSKFTIRSPFDGFVTSEQTEAGAWLRQGDPVAEVVEIDPVEVEVFLPELNVPYVKLGTEVEVTLGSLDDRVFQGRIDQLVPLADNRSRTFPVRVLIDNPAVDGQHVLLPGMLANVRLPISQANEALMVPKDALRLGGPTPSVFRLNNGTAQLVPVRTGESDGDWIAVSTSQPDALSEGDQVVTRGNERLRPGQAIAATGSGKP